MILLRYFRAMALTASVVLLGPANAGEGETLTVLTSRDVWHVAPAMRAFAAESGIEVAVVHRDGDIIGEIAAKGDRSEADVLLVEEFGPLLQARTAGITQAMDIAQVGGVVPAAFRDPDRHWIGLSRHARVVYAAKAQATQAAITYEELADPKWRGKICIRSGLHPYNLSLIASMIAHHGRDGAKRWLAGLKANLARKPEGNDRSQVKALAAGICQLAIANSYYMAEMEAAGGEQQQWAAAVRLLFPNAHDRGSHVTVSGIALMKHTRKRELAMKLIEYLVSRDGQQIYSIMQYAYPVIPDAPASVLAGGGEYLTADQLPLAQVARLLEDARSLAVEVDFDGATKF